jgi:hypothetical protein
MRTSFQEYEDSYVDDMRGVALWTYNDFNIEESEVLGKDIKMSHSINSVLKMESALVKVFDQKYPTYLS